MIDRLKEELAHNKRIKQEADDSGYELCDPSLNEIEELEYIIEMENRVKVLEASVTLLTTPLKATKRKSHD